MLKLNSKNWMRLRINKTTKVLTATNEQTYQTKSECENDIKSAQYIAINLKALNKLLSDGYTLVDTNIKEDKKVATINVELSTANTIIDLTGDAEVEIQIEAYTQMKIERDILAYEKKKRSQEAVERFLATPPKQEKQNPFDYDKLNQRYYAKQQPRNQRDKQRQIADYCGEVTL